MSTTVRFLIWDFDNTLAHRPGLWSQCLADLANAELPGIGLTREQLAPHVSGNFPWHRPERGHLHLSDPDDWWESLFPMLAAALVESGGIEADLAATIAGRMRAEYTDPEGWVVFPDTKPTLAALSERGWRHIILSNHVPELPQLVADLGLDHYFEHVLTSAALGYEKPHALAFQAAVDRVSSGVRVIMIGDNFVADYQGARSAGLDSILVRNSHPECEVGFPDLESLLQHLHEV